MRNNESPIHTDDANNDTRLQTHTLLLTDRARLALTGVEEVTAYDEYSATLQTPCGTLTIGGSEIRVRQISAEKGEVLIEGSIEYLQYQGRKKGDKEESFLKRLLR